MIQQKLSLFQCLTSSPSRAVGMEEIVRLIRYDSDVRYKTESYRKMASVLGKEKADEEVKRKMVPACSIGVLFDGNGRNAANILGFTGLALCDIDGLTPSLTPGPSPRGEGSDYSVVDEAFLKAKADPHTLIVYRTISGKGLRIIYRYTREAAEDSLSTPLSHRRGAGGEAVWRGAGGEAVLRGAGGEAISFPAAFLKGNSYYAELVEHEYDAQCADYSRLCGLAHDSEVYVNWEAEPFVITDDEILAANFSADKERGKPRREYAAGTHSVSVEDAWQNVEKTLAGRGLVYQRGHHHDYVMHAAFLMNRYGVDLDELLQWASQVWSDYNNKECENTIRSCYKKTQEHGTWRLNRKGRKPKETSMITLPEIKDWLRQHVEVIYNVVTDQLMYKSLTPYPSPKGEGSDYIQWLRGDKKVTTPLAPWRGVGGEAFGGAGGEAGGLLDERVVCSIRSQMAADTGKRVLKNDVMDVLRSDFARLYHPVREYIESLPAWDGRDRVKELCSHIASPSPSEGGGVEMPNAYIMPSSSNQTSQPPSVSPQMREGLGEASPCFYWALHKWLVACVASWMSDLNSNHEIFVLIGSQGIYKTTFFRHLLPPQLRMYFWENAHNSFSSKDDHLALAENCLVEIEEIDLQNPRDISELKALATSEKVKERRPYARFREEKHRLASFCGSGNQQHFLSDDTGNRRWLCFKVDHIDDPRTWALDYDQLYAQLRDELRQGFRYWFDPDEQRIVEQQNQAFRIESDEEQLIRSRLRPPRTTDKITLMNAASICQFINGGIVGRGLSTRKIGMAMRKLGFEHTHTRAGEFYKVYLIPPNDIQPSLAIPEDEQSVNETDTKAPEEGDLPF